MGGQVGERTDLYALGSMLYQMVAGTQPFLGDDPAAILSQHVNAQPVSPSWHNPECPRPLETLILRLLEKDCQGRSNLRPRGGAKVYHLSGDVQRKCPPATGVVRSP